MAKGAAVVSVGAGAPALTIRLVPQSSIQGRITDGSSEPIVGIGLSLTRVEIHDGRRQPRQSYARTSGGDGTFSFDNLPPGSFYLRAAGTKSGGPAEETYGPVYFPEAFTQDQAQLLQGGRAGKAIVADFHGWRVTRVITCAES